MQGDRRLAQLALTITLGGCGAGSLERLADEPVVPASSLGTRGAPPSSSTTAAPREPEAAPDDAVTRAPWPPEGEAEEDPRARALATACGGVDGGLERVARAVARARARGLGAPDADRVAAMLRGAGVPHVRPRVLSASGRAPLEAGDVRARIATLASPLARCGVAIARTPHGGEVAVAIAVDALADLAPLPRRARPGEWLTLDAKLHVEARSARVLVTGPRGLPRSVPATLDAKSGAVRARFALDRPGAFLVQVVGDVEGGPRPVLEASVGAGEAVLGEDDEAPAPGEEPESAEDAPALARMVTALRASEGLPPLARDTRLEAVARTHAERMAREGQVAHDLGDGDLRARAFASGLQARRVGENVARAATLARVHRALHASPSHRLNLLDAGYTRLGIGLHRAEDGFVYVCEVFGSD